VNDARGVRWSDGGVLETIVEAGWIWNVPRRFSTRDDDAQLEWSGLLETWAVEGLRSHEGGTE
jgi:hypothetical protein